MKESDHPFEQHSQNSTPQPPSLNRRRDHHPRRPNEQVLMDDSATDFVKPSSFSPNQDVTFTWMDDYLPVFRGPLIFCMVVTWIALPPVLEYITQPSSWPTIFTTILLFGSLLVTCHDVTVLCLNHTRSRLAHWIQHEAPSLDHLLAILYKFQTDATVTATASGMGHSFSMRAVSFPRSNGSESSRQPWNGTRKLLKRWSWNPGDGYIIFYQTKSVRGYYRRLQSESNIIHLQHQHRCLENKMDNMMTIIIAAPCRIL